MAMWTKPALARALRQQSLIHRRRNFTFTPAPLPREERQPLELPHKAEAQPPMRQPHSERVLSEWRPDRGAPGSGRQVLRAQLRSRLGRPFAEGRCAIVPGGLNIWKLGGSQWVYAWVLKRVRRERYRRLAGGKGDAEVAPFTEKGRDVITQPAFAGSHVPACEAGNADPIFLQQVQHRAGRAEKGAEGKPKGIFALQPARHCFGFLRQLRHPHQQQEVV